MRSRALSLFAFASIALAGIAAAVACGSEGGSAFPALPPDGGDPNPNPAPTGFNPEADARAPISFPAAPIIDGTAPANSKDIFAGATFAAAGGPCLMEPEVGAMLPRNWLRPRFKWIGTNALAGNGDGGLGGQSLFELRVHAENQTNDLVVYTTNPSWTMPREMWDQVRNAAAGTKLTMKVRGGTLVGDKLENASDGSSGDFTVAPVDAPGTIVYWTTASTEFFEDSKYAPNLKGFRVGDESVRDVLHPGQLPNMPDGKVQCVGCHTSTPDGVYTVSTTRIQATGEGPTSIGFGLVDGGAGLPPYVSPSAKTLFDRTYQAAPSFSRARFRDGDRVAVTMIKLAGRFEMIWTDLAATSTAQDVGWGIFDRTGDPNRAAAPNVSHDGSKVLYISTTWPDTAGNIVVNGDLYTIPWNERKGGQATELAGANVAGSRQFYPAFSPDDRLVAFDRSPLRGNTTTMSDPQAELYVVPASGATSATRLVANDPPACSGKKSPGIYNAWPKWSPDVGTDAAGNRYYFLVFSSTRDNNLARLGSRLYVTPVMVDPAGKITTYSALYLWNQPENEDNHSPSWDTLAIPDDVIR